jgi:hypothetical protein
MLIIANGRPPEAIRRCDYCGQDAQVHRIQVEVVPDRG